MPDSSLFTKIEDIILQDDIRGMKALRQHMKDSWLEASASESSGGTIEDSGIDDCPVAKLNPGLCRLHATRILISFMEHVNLFRDPLGKKPPSTLHVLEVLLAKSFDQVIFFSSRSQHD